MRKGFLERGIFVLRKAGAAGLEQWKEGEVAERTEQSRWWEQEEQRLRGHVHTQKCMVHLRNRKKPSSAGTWDKDSQ